MPAQAKLDLYKEHKQEYLAPREPVLIETSPAKYLVIAGRGEPGGERFQASLGALYAAAFTLKMASKVAGRDYAVCKLEGLWWGRKETGDFFQEPRSQWNWELLIRTPEFITSEHLEATCSALGAKGKDGLVRQVRLENLDEGRSVQMLHVGSYDAEQVTIDRMLEFARQQGLKPRGRHHEIYLSDPRRVPPERLRTILRQPVG
jgi:hypothetical protein